MCRGAELWFCFLCLLPLVNLPCVERRAGRVAVKAPVHLIINSVCLIHIPSQRGISGENHQPFNWRGVHRDCKALKVVFSHLKYMMCLNRPPSMQPPANPGVHTVCISLLIWRISFLLQVVSCLIFLLDIVLFHLHFNIICSTSQTWMQRKCVEINSKSPCSHIWDANLIAFMWLCQIRALLPLRPCFSSAHWQK